MFFSINDEVVVDINEREKFIFHINLKHIKTIPHILVITKKSKIKNKLPECLYLLLSMRFLSPTCFFFFGWNAIAKTSLFVVIQLLMFRGVTNGFSCFYMSAFKETSILYRYEACVHTAMHISFRDLNIFYSPFPSQMLKRNRLVMKAFE